VPFPRSAEHSRVVGFTLALQVVWRALEDATLDPRAQAGSRSGVFVGVMGNEWAQVRMQDYQCIAPHSMTGNGYCMIANRISYQLDLKGPSVAIDTACSSSLVATQMACAALRGGECDQAIVVGVNLILTPVLHAFYRQAGLSSDDGRCRPFSAKASGIGRGEGVGAVVLRTLTAAQADRLPIYALIKGGAINHDGRSNGITAPNRHSQSEVIREAYRRSGVDPKNISFIEAHGTGTILGDHIEVNALGDIHAVPRERPCAIGSIKGNLGHMEGASGIGGLIKVALSLHHGVVPASPYASSENPQLGLANKGLRLLKAPEKLAGKEAIAAISSFGLGGTNAHLVLATAPLNGADDARPEAGILTVSAPTPGGLKRSVELIVDDISSQSSRWIAQTCWTSNRVKSSGRYRLALVVRNHRQALADLQEAVNDPGAFWARCGAAASRVLSGWVFSGQSSACGPLIRVFYENCTAFRSALDEVDLRFKPHLSRSIVELALTNDDALNRFEYRAPGVFALEFALGRVLIEAGIHPAWMMGHGEGEYAAAALDGIVSLDDACYLAAQRGRVVDCEMGRELGDEFYRTAAKIKHLPVKTPMVSMTTGRQFKNGELIDTSYWVNQIRSGNRTELTGEATSELAITHLILIGPDGLTGVARKILAQAEAIPLAVCGAPTEDGYGLFRCIAELYKAGAKIEWNPLYSAGQRIRRRLSPYEFSTARRYWLNPTTRLSEQAPAVTSNCASAASETRYLLETSTNSGERDCLTREVIELVAEIGGYESRDIHEGSRLLEDLAYDSLVVVRLANRIQQRWNRRVPIDELTVDRTVGDIIAWLRQSEEQQPSRQGIAAS